MLGIFLVAVCVTALGIGLLRLLGPRLGLLDAPLDERKRHRAPKPVVGLALGAGTLAAGWLLARFPEHWVALGALALLLVGLDDDRHPRPAWWRLLAQCAVAVIVLWATGLGFQRVEVFGAQWALGVAALPLNVVWVVGLTNAFNLIDGSDGVALGVGGLIALGVAIVQDNPLAWALAGSCLVAWWFNKPPAEVFIGDGGAYFLGFLLALLSTMQGPHGTPLREVSLLGAGLVFLVPLSDLVYAVGRRALARRHLFSADTGHIHHRLQQRFAPWPMLLILYGLTIAGMLLGGWLWWR